MRWIDVANPLANQSFAGRLHIQVVHLDSETDDTMRLLQVETVESPVSAVPSAQLEPSAFEDPTSDDRLLQRIETGRGLPAWETGLRIARELGYDVTALEALFAEVKS